MPPRDCQNCRFTASLASVGDVPGTWRSGIITSQRSRGLKADESINGLSKSQYPTKAKILEALRTSVTDSAAALKESAGTEDPKIAELLVSFLEHTSEHYGQLAVHARLRGIVPPASRA